MPVTARLLIIGTIVASSLLPAQAHLLGSHHEYTEQELLSRIKRENNPVKKAKYQIELGQLKLDAAIQAYAHDDVEHGERLLQDYLAQMHAAWNTLAGSGRQATKKPQGFRELDIALREDGRLINDLKQRTQYMDRQPIEKIALELEKLHEQVLQALFPPPENQTSSKYRAIGGSHALNLEMLA
jgi:hypothetical protein